MLPLDMKILRAGHLLHLEIRPVFVSFPNTTPSNIPVSQTPNFQQGSCRHNSTQTLLLWVGLSQPDVTLLYRAELKGEGGMVPGANSQGATTKGEVAKKGKGAAKGAVKGAGGGHEVLRSVPPATQFRPSSGGERYQCFDPNGPHYVDPKMISLIAKHDPQQLKKIDIPGARILCFKASQKHARRAHRFCC